MIGAVGAAPLIVALPLPAPAPPPPEVVESETYQHEFTPGYHGTRLEYEQGGQWWSAGEVMEVTGPAYGNAGLSESAWMSRVAGLVGAGEISVVIAARSVAPDLLELLGTQKPVPFRIVLSDGGAVWRNEDEPIPDLSGVTGSTWEFEAWVTRFDQEVPVDGVLTATLTMTVQGEPTFSRYEGAA